MAVVTTIANETLPTGEYAAKITEISEETGQYGPQFKFLFEIAKPEDYKGKTLTGWTSQSGSLRSKFVKWASAILKRQIDEGEAIDTDDLLLKPVMLVVAAKVKTVCKAAGYRIGPEALAQLSAVVDELLGRAMERAQDERRQTIKDRDVNLDAPI